jgi:hypothetical protein
MKYTLTFRDETFDVLGARLHECPGLEGAAYVLCGVSRLRDEVRLLAREVVGVDDRDYVLREADRLSIASLSYSDVAKRAAAEEAAVLFVHSHPGGQGLFSKQDDVEEPKLMNFFTDRVPGAPHGTLVLGADPELSGRVWQGLGWAPIERVRILGGRFRFVFPASAGTANEIPPFFDRQVRSFGLDVQRLLGQLHVGVVGVGGTGSATAEQLCRLGVGELSLFDGERLEASNVSRVYGSSALEVARLKAEIVASHLHRIGIGTTIRVFPLPITLENVAQKLRACDVVFGCTDRQAPRGILVNLSLYYLIPVFDVGVKVDAPGGALRSIDGRVTILWPGAACLFCRGGISADVVALESLSPDEQRLRIDEGYAPALEGAEPAVVTFTTAVAAKAVTEFLHRMTGFMGPESPSEFRMLFHHDSVRGTSQQPSSSCYCAQQDRWARGDRRRFLDLSWAS